jgi:hypothetical protein
MLRGIEAGVWKSGRAGAGDMPTSVLPVAICLRIAYPLQSIYDKA